MKLTTWPNGNSLWEKIPEFPEIKTIVSPSNILDYVWSSDILLKLLSYTKNNETINVFKKTFLDNIDFLKWLQNTKDHSKELNILKNLKEIDQQAKQTTKDIVNSMFKDFFPKTFNINNFLQWLWDFAFLEKENYDNFKSPSQEAQKVVFDIYLISVNYIISYNRYLIDISNYLTETLKEQWNIDWNIQKLVVDALQNIEMDDKEKTYISQVLLILWSKLSKTDKGKEIFENIILKLKKARFKTPVSSVKKLFKSAKYREQFDKLKILPDWVWFLFEYDDIWDLRFVASFFKEESEKKDFVGKFNDRWVLSKNHTNNDTIKWITPFVNTEVIWKDDWREYTFGELSLRLSSKNQIKEIIEENQDDLYSLLKNLISKVDFLNHEIYKFAQDIKIVRSFVVDNNIINTKNKKVWVDKLIQNNLSNIKVDVLNNLKKIFSDYNIAFNEQDVNLILELIILKVLLEKLEDVLEDLAWESVLDNIKNTKAYKKSKEDDKRNYLKRLSGKFKKQYDNPGSNPITHYSDEIKAIYVNYNWQYNKIRKSAKFYKEIEKKINQIQKVLKKKKNEIEKSSNELLNLLK